jgi:hypothetical protein
MIKSAILVIITRKDRKMTLKKQIKL